MTSLPTLALPDFSKAFVIETDASRVGLGAVLMQDEKPLVYFSHKLRPQAQGKSVYETELMAIVLAIRQWRPYLLGHKFIICTDQQNLKYLLEQRVVEEEYHKWLLKLMGYHFDIQYKPGKENTTVDALSKLLAEVTLTIISIPFVLDFGELEEQVVDDPYLDNILTTITTNPTTYPTLLRPGLLYVIKEGWSYPQHLLSFHTFSKSSITIS